MDIGVHCAKSDCQQVDFLPFTCDCCASIFCLEHRSYDAHACPHAGSRDRRVVQCPLCKQMIRWTLEQDVNLVWEQHVHSGQCVPDPSTVDTKGNHVAPKKKKNRCAAERCREVLLTSNQFHCSKCGLDVCLRHRFESDHDCEGVRQRRRQQRASIFSRPSVTSSSASRPAPAASINTTRLQQNARAAATSVASGTRSAVNTLVQKGKAVAASVSSTTEECPMCQQKFTYVSQLIAHVNRSHPDADTHRQSRPAPSGPSPTLGPTTISAASGGSEVCPQCRAVFQDVTTLISHVESAHRVAQVSTGANAQGDEKCSVM